MNSITIDDVKVSLKPPNAVILALNPKLFFNQDGWTKFNGRLQQLYQANIGRPMTETLEYTLRGSLLEQVQWLQAQGKVLLKDDNVNFVNPFDNCRDVEDGEIVSE